jgi:hypothetical protein
MGIRRYKNNHKHEKDYLDEKVVQSENKKISQSHIVRNWWLSTKSESNCWSWALPWGKKDYQNASSHVPWLKPIFPVGFCNA